MCSISLAVTMVSNVAPLGTSGLAPVLPDLAFIKRRIPIVEVARELGIRPGHQGATWTTARCFRPHAHKAADRTPSLNFQTKRNKYMCFACDDRLHSNVDLVMAMLVCSLREALQWFDEHYPGIPRIKAKTEPVIGFEFRAGVDEFRTPEDLVRAGLVPHLTDSALRVFTVLAAFRDKNDVAVVSYHIIKLRSGIRTNYTVAQAIRQLEGLSILERHRRWTPKRAGGRDTSQYCFTFDDPDLFALLAARGPSKQVKFNTD
jgi:hypothetical protein